MPKTRKLSGIMWNHRPYDAQGRKFGKGAPKATDRAAGCPNRKLLRKKINQPRKVRNSQIATLTLLSSFSFLTGIRVTGNNFHASCSGLRGFQLFRIVCQWELMSPYTYQFHAESAGLGTQKLLRRLQLCQLGRLKVQDLLTLVV